jgi:hypothetical protein
MYNKFLIPAVAADAANNVVAKPQTLKKRGTTNEDNVLFDEAQSTLYSGKSEYVNLYASLKKNLKGEDYFSLNVKHLREVLPGLTDANYAAIERNIGGYVNSKGKLKNFKLLFTPDGKEFVSSIPFKKCTVTHLVQGVVDGKDVESVVTAGDMTPFLSWNLSSQTLDEQLNQERKQRQAELDARKIGINTMKSIAEDASQSAEIRIKAVSALSNLASKYVVHDEM